MQETFLHYLFEHQLITNTEFEIISPGTKNTNAGPDFFNAKIKIGSTIWAGNIEIHIHSSDWHKHKHNNDKAYDSIILHLVLIHDQDIYTTKGVLIPTFEIKFNSKLYDKYTQLLQNKTWIHCEKEIKKIDSLTKLSYIESLAIERLKRKNKYFKDLLTYNTNNWEETFYQALAKGFGGKLNAIPFELLTKSIPLNILQKHQNNIIQIEALLFGQSGLLENKSENDVYYNQLQKEYNFLKNKYNLTPIRIELWKFSKIRPYNFPSIKIALFAQLVFKHQNLLSKIIDCSTIEDVKKLFNITASSYWTTHYRFLKDSKELIKTLGYGSIQHLIINILIPFLFTYSESTNKDDIKEKYFNWYSNLDKEDNSITKKWEELNFKNQNAMQSQGLIELKNEKCDKHKCIDCRIGHKILTLSWNE